MTTVGSPRFERALPTILRCEGGYVDNPNDPGGATNFGVIQRTYDAWRDAHGLPRRPVREIERDEVRAVYWQRYWLAARCDELPTGVDLAHFDAAVNTGTRRAAKLLQRALGVAVDGVIGPVTLAAARSRDPIELVHDMLFRRLRFYADIARRRRSDGRDLKVFLPGWIIRVVHLRSALLEV